MTDELWQGYNEQGEPTGSVTLSQARNGALHGAAHIWIWQRSGKHIRVLLQTRSKNSPTWPEYLDISAAGHIDAHESPLQTAVCETNEEIGAGVRAEQLRLLFVYRQKVVAPPEDITENEFQWVYGLQLDPKKHLHLIDGEVESLYWIDLRELKQLASEPSAVSNLVPHGSVYFAELFQAIEQANAD